MAIGIYNLKPVAISDKVHEEMHGHWKWWQRLEGQRIFHSKNVDEPIEYSRCFRCHVSINLLWFRKILIVLFVTKQYQPFCVRTGGDALMKLPCYGLLPSRDERSHIFQTPTPVLLHALRLLLRLQKFLKHQLRLLLTLWKVPSNSCWKDTVYFASWGKICVVAILPLIEHKWLKWSCD